MMTSRLIARVPLMTVKDGSGRGDPTPGSSPDRRDTGGRVGRADRGEDEDVNESGSPIPRARDLIASYAPEVKKVRKKIRPEIFEPSPEDSRRNRRAYRSGGAGIL